MLSHRVTIIGTNMLSSYSNKNGWDADTMHRNRNMPFSEVMHQGAHHAWNLFAISYDLVLVN